MQIEITREVAQRCLTIVDAGLSNGVGEPIPGQMCVEAAICYALGLPHGDDPQCVSPALRQLKISLNDKRWSSNEVRAKGLRRLALVQLGSAGHLDDVEFTKRVAELAIRKFVPLALRAAASIQTNAEHRARLLNAANRCESEGMKGAAYAAAYAAAAASDAAAAASDAAAASYAAAAASYAAAAASDAAASYAAAAASYAAVAASDAAAAASDAAASDAAAARDKVLADFAEDVVKILVEMKVPGAQWLDLAEAA